MLGMEQQDAEKKLSSAKAETCCSCEKWREEKGQQESDVTSNQEISVRIAKANLDGTAARQRAARGAYEGCSQRKAVEKCF